MDSQLNQLARMAQQYPDRSYERRQVLSKLVDGILQSGKLGRPRRASFPFSPAVYDDLYREALNTTLMEICKNIDKYKPERDVMAWCNFILDKRFTDIFNQYTGGGMNASLPTLEDLDSFIPPPEEISAGQQLKQLIEENPDQMFTKDRIKGHPETTFQELAIAKIWDDRKWQDISSELDIPMSSLCEFFYRQLKKFKPYFREYLIE